MTTTKKQATKTRAKVEWDGDGRWVATVAPNVFTQAKQIAQLRPRIAEVVKLMTGKDIDPDDVELDIDFPGAAVAAEVRCEREDLAAREAVVNERLATIVHELHRRGVSFRDIGVMCGISHQRAHQLADQPLVDA